MTARARHIIGNCWLCEEPCFAVERYYPPDHGLYPGQPVRLGPPYPGTKRVELVYTSGIRTHLTLCASCRITPEGLPDLQRKLWDEDDGARARVANGHADKVWQQGVLLGVLAELDYSALVPLQPVIGDSPADGARVNG